MPNGRAEEAEQWQRSSGAARKLGASREPWEGWAWGKDIHSISHCRDGSEVSARRREQGPLPGLAGSVFTQWAAGAAAGKISWEVKKQDPGGAQAFHSLAVKVQEKASEGG